VDISLPASILTLPRMQLPFRNFAYIFQTGVSFRQEQRDLREFGQLKLIGI
jgi:hypothetical protein